MTGLDSYNAYNVIESLKTLAKQYNRTVIFTIHQPQSNIVALFDRLILLGKGQLVYSGETSQAQRHFEKAGYSCPQGYNIADYLIDVTVEASGDHRTSNRTKTNGHIAPVQPNGGSRHSLHADDTSDDDDDSTSTARQGPRRPQPEGVVDGIKKKAHQLLGAFSTNGADHTGTSTPDDQRIPEKLANLVLACRASDGAKIVEAEINRIQSGQTPGGADGFDVTRDITQETELLRGYKKASYWTQFTLLSQRAFKNLYR